MGSSPNNAIEYMILAKKSVDVKKIRLIIKRRIIESCKRSKFAKLTKAVPEISSAIGKYMLILWLQKKQRP